MLGKLETLARHAVWQTASPTDRWRQTPTRKKNKLLGKVQVAWHAPNPETRGWQTPSPKR